MRIESDHFGEVSLLKGDLYGIQTRRCIDNLCCSPYRLSSFPELIRALALVKKAAASANEKAGIVPAAVADLICQACDQIVTGEFDEHFPVDMLHGGGSIAFNQNINEVVANLANLAGGGTIGSYSPVHPKQHVNASQSTANSCSTAFRLAIISVARTLITACNMCAEQLQEKSSDFHGTMTVARTCLQDALVVDATTILDGWSEVLERRAEQFKRSSNHSEQ